MIAIAEFRLRNRMPSLAYPIAQPRSKQGAARGAFENARFEETIKIRAKSDQGFDFVANVDNLPK